MASLKTVKTYIIFVIISPLGSNFLAVPNTQNAVLGIGFPTQGVSFQLKMSYFQLRGHNFDKNVLLTTRGLGGRILVKYDLFTTQGAQF